jgi:hypothetical protein
MVNAVRAACGWRASAGRATPPTLGSLATLARPALAAAHAAITPSDWTDALNAGPLDPQSPDPLVRFTVSAAALLLCFALGCQALPSFITPAARRRNQEENKGSRGLNGISSGLPLGSVSRPLWLSPENAGRDACATSVVSRNWPYTDRGIVALLPAGALRYAAKGGRLLRANGSGPTLQGFSPFALYDGTVRNVVSGKSVGKEVLHMLTLRAMGGGVRPLRDRPRRGGERSSWQPGPSSMWRTPGWGGRARSVAFAGVGAGAEWQGK